MPSARRGMLRVANSTSRTRRLLGSGERLLSRSKLLAHAVDGLSVSLKGARLLEDGRARHEHVHARLGNLLDVARAHATVDLKADVVARLVDHLARLLRLLEGGRDEALAAEARVDGHEEDDVKLVHHVLANVKRGGRVEHKTRLAAVAPDEREGAVDVRRRLRVEGDVRGTRLGEVADDAVHRRDHQVHVNRLLDTVVAEGLAHHRADGEVRHVVVVHDVKVDHIGAALHGVLHLRTQRREVSAEDRRRDEEVLLRLDQLHARGGAAAAHAGGAGGAEGADRAEGTGAGEEGQSEHDLGEHGVCK
mmetsp:Transcript_22054/g.39427  ORF Transcript_22054/g.39427 Transcript_22054/m.39427 type:complete len:306 (-) Transcript_22054:9-926(-)